MAQDLKQAIKDKARQLGFILAGVTIPEPTPHYETFEHWLAQGHHGTMNYLAAEKARAHRADPIQILPECKSILVLATPYSSPLPKEDGSRVRAAYYAHGADYHDVLTARMEELVQFIEEQVGGPIKSRWYTDTGPIL